MPVKNCKNWTYQYQFVQFKYFILLIKILRTVLQLSYIMYTSGYTNKQYPNPEGSSSLFT